MKTHILTTFILACLGLSSYSFGSEYKESIRLGHVQELLGNSYRRSVASVTIKHQSLEENHLKLVKELLPSGHQDQAREISMTIIQESLKYKMDPMFVSAIIMNESSFRPTVRGSSGEIGLMQILPRTGKWLAKKIGIEWQGSKTLENPLYNIKMGTAYMGHLREKYRHGQLYLAAYNMGPGNLSKALRRQIRPEEYTYRVMVHYFDLYKKIL